MLSINTNLGAMIALQQLNTTNKTLERTQLNITTGLMVNGPEGRCLDLRHRAEHAW